MRRWLTNYTNAVMTRAWTKRWGRRMRDAHINIWRLCETGQWVFRYFPFVKRLYETDTSLSLFIAIWLVTNSKLWRGLSRQTWQPSCTPVREATLECIANFPGWIILSATFTSFAAESFQWLCCNVGPGRSVSSYVLPRSTGLHTNYLPPSLKLKQHM